jgi:hypothetical protein
MFKFSEYPNIVDLCEYLQDYHFNYTIKETDDKVLEKFENFIKDINFEDIYASEYSLSFKIDKDHYIKEKCNILLKFLDDFKECFYILKNWDSNKKKLLYIIFDNNFNVYNYELIRDINELNNDFILEIYKIIKWIKNNDGRKYYFTDFDNFYLNGSLEYDFNFFNNQTIELTLNLGDEEKLKHDIIFYEVIKDSIEKLNTLKKLTI